MPQPMPAPTSSIWKTTTQSPETALPRAAAPLEQQRKKIAIAGAAHAARAAWWYRSASAASAPRFFAGRLVTKLKLQLMQMAAVASAGTPHTGQRLRSTTPVPVMTAVGGRLG